MPYYNRDSKKEHNFDHPYKGVLQGLLRGILGVEIAAHLHRNALNPKPFRLLNSNPVAFPDGSWAAGLGHVCGLWSRGLGFRGLRGQGLYCDAFFPCNPARACSEVLTRTLLNPESPYGLPKGLRQEIPLYFSFLARF